VCSPGTRCITAGDARTEPFSYVRHPQAPVPKPVHGKSRRRPILGGLINRYEAAAWKLLVKARDRVLNPTPHDNPADPQAPPDPAGSIAAHRHQRAAVPTHPGHQHARDRLLPRRLRGNTAATLRPVFWHPTGGSGRRRDQPRNSCGPSRSSSSVTHRLSGCSVGRVVGVKQPEPERGSRGVAAPLLRRLSASCVSRSAG